MKELKEQTIYLEGYDVTVTRYLTYGQIQEIVKAAKQAKTWAERQTNIDMMVLLYVTDIPMGVLEELGHDEMIKSGLIDSVTMYVENLYEIDKALEYEESLNKALFELSNKLPEIANPLKEVINKHGDKYK